MCQCCRFEMVSLLRLFVTLFKSAASIKFVAIVRIILTAAAALARGLMFLSLASRELNKNSETNTVSSLHLGTVCVRVFLCVKPLETASVSHLQALCVCVFPYFLSNGSTFSSDIISTSRLALCAFVVFFFTYI